MNVNELIEQLKTFDGETPVVIHHCGIYDIELSCGCMISLDGGGGLMDCMSDDCKYDEEYKNSPKYKKYQREIKRRNE